MRRQLRATEGALSGAVFVVRGRTRIGRASDSDIQILHDGISRQHAQVVEDGAVHLGLPYLPRFPALQPVTPAT